jgi:hypothetical protein
MPSSTVARPMFSRRQYVAIADALAGERGWENGVDLERAAEVLASVFEADNERFDRRRFLAACGSDER